VIRRNSRLHLLRAALALVATLASFAGACRAPERTEERTPYNLGKEALLARDYPTAVTQLTLAIDGAQKGSFPAEALLARGEAHLAIAAQEDRTRRADDLALALKDIESVLENAREHSSASLMLRALAAQAKALLAIGDDPAAETTLREVLRLDTEHGALRLSACRDVGWIQFRKAEAGIAPAATAEDERRTQERFREAQDQFSAGLQIDADDPESNLGKGMCLYFRGQHRDAVVYLERAAALADRIAPEPRGHFYLARALEKSKGFYETALDHYRQATAADPGRSFKPLYAHLMDVLIVYLDPSQPEFALFLDAILGYRQEDPEYWRKAEDLATRLVDSEVSAEKGREARALARARNRKTDEAVDDALDLQMRADFVQLVERIFPADPGRPDYLYGRALTLFKAGRHEELATFFQDEVFRTLDEEARQSRLFQRTLVVEGRNIVAHWLKEAKGQPATNDAKLDRDRRLGKARDAFQAYLDRFPQEHDVRMALGEVQELMESFPAAYVSYAFIAGASDDPVAPQRILRLHKERLLPEKVETEAWNLLRRYRGGDLEIEEYVARTRYDIEADVKLYCRWCGRKGAQGDLMCIECGRRLGR
jgi:tetratricopeptide (TPR) repeat protein